MTQSYQVILHSYNKVIFWRKNCREDAAEAPEGFVSLATRFKHLSKQESHQHRLPLLRLQEIRSICLCTCCRSDFPWNMSWFLNTVGVVTVYNSDREIRS